MFVLEHALCLWFITTSTSLAWVNVQMSSILTEQPEDNFEYIKIVLELALCVWIIASSTSLCMGKCLDVINIYRTARI